MPFCGSTIRLAERVSRSSFSNGDGINKQEDKKNRLKYMYRLTLAVEQFGHIESVKRRLQVHSDLRTSSISSAAFS